PQLTEEVLSLLRTWGWSTGLKKLKATVHVTRDKSARKARQLYLEWLAGDDEVDAAALKHHCGGPMWPALVGWALAGPAAVALRERQYPRTHQLLDQAQSQGDPTDTVLRAMIAHTRGGAYGHQGKGDAALPHLHEALALLGREHFGSG